MPLIAKATDNQPFVPQGTPEWVRERIGCLTASNMAKALSFLKNGGESAERKKLKVQIVAERMADAAIDHYVTPEMQWGLDTEDEAQAAYAELSGNEVYKGGFVRHPEIEFFGASPDLFVFPDGLAETKCPRTETHVGYLIAGEVPDDYKPQMLAQLACTRRKWCDFISYDPRIQAARSRIFVRRFAPPQEDIEAIEQAARKFLAEVDDLFRKVTEG